MNDLGLTAMHQEVVIRDKYIVKSYFFHLGFVKFSLCCLSICGFIWRNTVELGGFRKEVCYSDESQYPYEGFCGSLSHLCQGKGGFPIYPQLLQCMDRVIQDNPH